MDKQREISVRKATDADLDDIVRIWRQLMDEHAERDPRFWGLLADAEEVYRKYKTDIIKGGEHVVFVAEIDSTAAGFISGQVLGRPPIFKVDKVGRVNEIVVNKDHRGVGVGQALMERMAGEFKSWGLIYVDLMVDFDNDNARAFYKASGFIPRELHMIMEIG